MLNDDCFLVGVRFFALFPDEDGLSIGRNRPLSAVVLWRSAVGRCGGDSAASFLLPSVNNALWTTEDRR